MRSTKIVICRLQRKHSDWTSTPFLICVSVYFLWYSLFIDLKSEWPFENFPGLKIPSVPIAGRSNPSETETNRDVTARNETPVPGLLSPMSLSPFKNDQTENALIPREPSNMTSNINSRRRASDIRHLSPEARRLFLQRTLPSSQVPVFGPNYQPLHGWNNEGYFDGTVVVTGIDSRGAIVGHRHEISDRMHDNFMGIVKLYHWNVSGLCLVWTEFLRSASFSIPEHGEWRSYIQRFLTIWSVTTLSDERLQDMDAAWDVWYERHEVLPHVQKVIDRSKIQPRPRRRSRSPGRFGRDAMAVEDLRAGYARPGTPYLPRGQEDTDEKKNPLALCRMYFVIAVEVC